MTKIPWGVFQALREHKVKNLLSKKGTQITESLCYHMRKEKEDMEVHSGYVEMAGLPGSSIIMHNVIDDILK